MKKITLELFRISKVNVKFSVMLSSDMNDAKKGVINRYTIDGNEYTVIQLASFVTIGISSWEKEYDSNDTINFSRVYMYQFLKSLKSMIDKFQEKELYYINNSKLYVNKELSESRSEVTRTFSKAIKIQHVVGNVNGEEYESLCFMINHATNSFILTLEEAEYLHYELSRVDYSTLSVQLMNTYMIEMLKDNSGMPVNTSVIQKVVTEKEMNEYGVKVKTHPEYKGVMPEI